METCKTLNNKGISLYEDSEYNDVIKCYMIWKNTKIE